MQTPDAHDRDGPESVSQLAARIKMTLERAVGAVDVEGELSNVAFPASGHWYFSVKDDDAVIDVVMFRSQQRNAESRPSSGARVRITGTVSSYPPRSRYQIIASSLRQAGEGQILAMLEQRKRALAAEGLFDRHRPLPSIPRRVAVVTSPGGAAVRDVLQVLARRRAPLSVLVVPVSVQGQEAPGQIVAALRYVNRHALADLIVLTRGGGSTEDLLAFSDEQVVRAVAASQIPTLSAVGHEIDFALTDFAADQRAPTPSAAAEMVAPEVETLLGRIAGAKTTLRAAIHAQLRAVRRRLESVTQDELRYRFRNYMQPAAQRLDEARRALSEAVTRAARERRSRLARALATVEAASPALQMERGYAVVRDGESRTIITRRALLGDRDGTLRVSFHDGDVVVHRGDGGDSTS